MVVNIYEIATIEKTDKAYNKFYLNFQKILALFFEIYYSIVRPRDHKITFSAPIESYEWVRLILPRP